MLQPACPTARDLALAEEGLSLIAQTAPATVFAVTRRHRLQLQAMLLDVLRARGPVAQVEIYWRRFLTWSPHAVMGCGLVRWQCGEVPRSAVFAAGGGACTLRPPTCGATEALAVHLGVWWTRTAPQ